MSNDRKLIRQHDGGEHKEPNRNQQAISISHRPGNFNLHRYQRILDSMLHYTRAMSTLSLLEHHVVHHSIKPKTKTLKTYLSDHFAGDKIQNNIQLKVSSNNEEHLELHIEIDTLVQPCKVRIKDHKENFYDELHLDEITKASPDDFYVLVGKEKLKISTKHIKPRPLQMRAIEAFTKALLAKNTAQLALMGTGTGKSFVGAGIGLALNQGVYIVPAKSHALEMKKDALETIRKYTNTNPPIHIGSNLKVEDLQQLVEETGLQDMYLILETDDPDFPKKTALIKHQFVLIDEAHQHTLTTDGLNILKGLMEENIVLALTGTPTQKLFEEMGKQIVDINLRMAQDAGAVREMCVQRDVAFSHDIIEQLAAHYFGSWTMRKGDKSKYFSEMKLDSALCANVNELERRLIGVIESTLEKEMEAGRLLINNKQKGFIFSEDKGLRTAIVNYFEDLYKHSVSEKLDLAVLQTLAKSEEAQYKSFLEAFYQHAKQLGFELTEENKQKLDQAIVKHYKRKIESCLIGSSSENFRKQMINAQKEQIAQAILASAVHILFGEKHSKCEKFIRNKTLAKELCKREFKVEDQNNKVIQEKLAALYPALPKKQKKVFHHLIIECIKQIQNILAQSSSNDRGQYIADLFDSISANMRLSELQAKYIVEISSNPEDKERLDEVLDQLRAGLIMQLVSDRVFATGISIPSVLSTQQTITCQADLDALYIMQAFGRPIRDDDEYAFVQQVVKSALTECHYLKVEDIVSYKSGELLKDVLAKRHEQLQHFHEMRQALENEMIKLKKMSVSKQTLFAASKKEKRKPTDILEKPELGSAHHVKK